MTLNPKERMRHALQRAPLDRLPIQVNYTTAMGQILAAHYGVTAVELPARLGNHLRRVDLSFTKRLSADVGAGYGACEYDWWGAGWNTETEGYWHAHAPLAESQDLDAFPWPDPNAPDLLDQAAEVIAADGGQHFVVPNFGFALFERAWSLRGFNALLIDMLRDPTFTGDLLDRIADIQVALARRFVALGVDGGYFGDDYGSQASTLFSPKTWRSLIKPRLARMFAVFREAGLPVILHSDGNIAAILPDLVEIGLTVLNPVQPEVLDHRWLKETYRDQLAFYGGVSTQTVLPSGTPGDVQAAVTACAQTLACDGTGLVLAPSHRMMTDVPLVNVDALLAAFAEVGGVA